MAWAAEKEIEVDFEKVFIYKESRILCQAFGLDPLGVIASGALLLTLSPSDFLPIQKVFRKNDVPLNVIGKVKKGPGRVLKIGPKGREELKPLPADEIVKVFSNGRMECMVG
jgi:hydrogenase maturation factor